MTGMIAGKQVVGHPVLIVRGWGLGALLRCLLAIARRRRCTFLELAVRKETRS